MAVYEYQGVVKKREEFLERGTVVAKTEDEALQKLKSLRLTEVKLKKLPPIRSLLSRISADIR